MKKLKVLRIDERLIHGQVVTAWLQKTKADTIVVADDIVARDPLAGTLFKMAIPKSIELKILSIDETIEFMEDDEPANVMLITGNLESTYELIEKGLQISEINIGNINQSSEKKKYSKSIWLDDKDINYIHKIIDTGVDIKVQVVPSERKRDIASIL
ncbi:PTS sugar transporter subunit IIB [Carnobacteriaceae bacterium 52-44]